MRPSTCVSSTGTRSGAGANRDANSPSGFDCYAAKMRMAESGSRAVARYRQSRPWKKAVDPTETPPSAPPLSVAPLGEDRVVAGQTLLAIDLLNPEPAVIIDRERLAWAVSFGFVGGDVGGMLQAALQRAPVAPSDWEPESFAAGLFVSDLIRTCMRVRVGTLEPAIDALFVARVLTHPPRELAVVEYRRAVLRELTRTPGARAELETVYQALHQLRALLDAQGSSADLDGRSRRLEALVSLRDSLALMARSFAGAQSGLARIRSFAEQAIASDGYSKLVELLDYENHMASVELKLRIGADGKIRRFEIERIRENRDNRFHQSAFGRWLTRVLLWLRGYSLGEIELVNRWVDAIFEGVQELVPPMLQLLGEIEVYLAALAFKDAAEQKGLAVCLPELSPDRTTPLRYAGLFNPLLFSQGTTPVPCDLELAQFETTTLLTGPNSGGKTRLLQALAIAQMLGQAGFHVPAASATLGCAKGLFVSLIEEARADQKEGRLGTELLRIRTLFERSHPGSLIILDELCSGTNPSEGEDIIRLVLSLLGELRPCVFITTHFLQFARRLSEESSSERLSFLQVELDELERPTYRFVPGVARTSLAHQTARRLGVTREELLALIRRTTS
jgi:DNA mismatch repair protein MutS2